MTIRYGLEAVDQAFDQQRAVAELGPRTDYRLTAFVNCLPSGGIPQCLLFSYAQVVVAPQLG
jgi:hypothetical protein